MTWGIYNPQAGSTSYAQVGSPGSPAFTRWRGGTDECMSAWNDPVRMIEMHIRLVCQPPPPPGGGDAVCTLTGFVRETNDGVVLYESIISPPPGGPGTIEGTLVLVGGGPLIGVQGTRNRTLNCFVPMEFRCDTELDVRNDGAVMVAAPPAGGGETRSAGAVVNIDVTRHMIRDPGCTLFSTPLP
jgi:hypothetical protein